ncbi:MAG: hypothetical protein MJ239_04070 [Bacilli bacterium]|nr:hypothetical protein [Bacilli bacterium]
MKKQISKLLLIPTFLGLVACSTNSGAIDLTKNAPDFSNRERQFMTFGYSSTNDGTYTENGVKINTGVDHRTAANFKDYKDAGLNVMMIQQNYGWWDGDFKNSDLSWMMDLCIEAEIDRCIISDMRIYELSMKETPIVGPGCLYETQEDLVEYVRDRMSNYMDHPCFYGLLIRDEPFHQMLPAFGSVYRAIKTVKPDAYIEANLLPYDSSEQARYRYCPDYASCTAPEAYNKYLHSFVENAQPEKLMMDSYPILVSGSSTTIKTDHLIGLQMLSKFCSENNIRFEAIAQTFAGTISGNEKWATQNVATMNWQLNAYLGFGVKTLGYFTYWRKADNSNGNGGEWFTDGTSFVTLNGQKTPLYYTMQTLHKEIQDFAPCMYDFQYQGVKCLSFEPTPYDTRFMSDVPEDDFTLLDDDHIHADEGSLMLTTELKDPTTGQYMYMVENIVNPLLKKSEYEDIAMHYSLDFGSKYNAAEVYYRGVKKLVPLKNGVYSGYLDAGYADYIMPYVA